MEREMAQEVVISQMPNLELVNKDIILTVKEDGEIIGKLAISKGGIKWTPRGKSVNVIEKNWSQFDTAMQALAKK